MRIFPILGWMLFPGCWAVTGPRAVHGSLDGSVTVRCRYREDYENYKKFWCRVGSWGFCSNIVETDGSEAEVKRGRVSIRDNHPQRAFTVTMENLILADAGMYQCGVKRFVLPDLWDTVKLTASPDKSTPRPSVTVQPDSSSPSKPNSIRATAEKGKPSVSTNHDTTDSGRGQESDILYHILLPCVLLVLVLFLIAAVMLVRLSKKRKKALSGVSVQRDKKIHLSDLGSEEVSYATVTISTPDQQPIYANMEQRPKTRRPANPAEETLYSAVK